MSAEPMSIDHLVSARRWATGVDLAAIAVSLVANVVAAPWTPIGVMLAAVAPVFLGLTVMVWHRTHGILTGWAGRGFNLGLLVVAGLAMAVSFSHIRHVAVTSGGQTEREALALPIVIDLVAVLMAVIVVETGRRIEAERQRIADDDERRRLADAEALAAEAEAKREAAAAAERARLDHERAMALEAARAEAAAAEFRTIRRKAEAGADGGDTETAVTAFVAAHASERDGKGPTLAATAKALGITPRSVQRSAAWKARHDQPAPEPVDPADDPTTDLDPAALLAVGPNSNGATAHD